MAAAVTDRPKKERRVDGGDEGAGEVLQLMNPLHPQAGDHHQTQSDQHRGFEDIDDADVPADQAKDASDPAQS